MPEWLYEAGIGEARAALVADGAIVEAAIDLGGLRLGTIAHARLIDLIPGGMGVVALDAGEALLTRIPPGVTQGATLIVEIVREAIPEPGRPKLARARATAAAPADGPDLRARLTASGVAVRECLPHQPDSFEAAGWSELLDEAITGDILFHNGALRMSPTPAMTLFDVDGPAPIEPLAIAAARSVALAIRRHGIGGSIGIDFPTLGGKAPRQAVAEAIDANLALPFERTTVNGFGFLQIVRPRPRASIPELLRSDPLGSAARAALRRIEREPPGAPLAYRLPAAVIAWLQARPALLAELARRTGVVHRLEIA